MTNPLPTSPASSPNDSSPEKGLTVFLALARTIQARRVSGVFLEALCLLVAFLQWLHLWYRYDLFLNTYHSEPWLNHVADELFAEAYWANVVLLVVAAAAACLLWPRSAVHRVLVCLAGLANIGACVALYLMHQTGVLVTYGEFAANLGP